MITSGRDRLAALFRDTPLPAPPPANTKTFAEQDLEAQLAQANPKQVSRPQQSQVQSPPSPQPRLNMDPLTSSDEEDDYVAAFKSKVTMKPATSKSFSNGARTIHKQPPQSPNKGAESLDLNENLSKDLPKADKRGRAAVGHFCLFNLVTKFPYKYMNDANSRVSRHFFADGKIYRREWDLYYLHGPETSLRQPLHLVPYKQVKALIDEIAHTFKAKVAVPKYPFTISFFDDGTPQPQFLGTCTSREDINECQVTVPPADPGHGEPPVDASESVEMAFADFKSKFENVQGAGKKSKNTASKKKAAEYAVIIRSWCQSWSRAQRYFGLRPAPAKPAAVDESMSWEDQLAFLSKTSDSIPAAFSTLDPHQPVPFAFEKSPVLISVDVECYERGHHIITEVGISTLDTLDLVGMSPGENGKKWREQIRSRHFRIQEYAHIRNTEFCRGDPEAFQFGQSEMVGLKDIGSTIDSCFEWPFSVQYKHNGQLKIDTQQWDANIGAMVPITNATGFDTQALLAQDPSELQRGPKERTILLVGHGLKADLDFLRALDSSIFSTTAGLSRGATAYPSQNKIDLSGLDAESARGAKGLNSIREALDTATLYQVLKQDQNPRSLAAMLYDLNISGFYLHNGGNDARYTLEGLVALVIKSRQMDDEESARQAAEAAKVMEAWK